MPNKREAADHDRAPHRPNLTAAVFLLRQALAPHATVEWVQPSDASAGAVVTVTGAGTTGGTQCLRLVPWSAPAHRKGPARRTRTTTDCPIVWVLPRSSAAIRETLRAHGEQYIDLRGAVHLALPWALVDRADLTLSHRLAGSLRPSVDPFADRSSLVVRTLLEHGDLERVWGVRELAGVAGVGVATASDVLRALAERELVTITRRGRASEVRLRNAIATVEAWTRSYDWRLNRGIAVHAPVGDLTRFMHRLPRLMPTGARWGLTMQAGASLVAPHATWDRVHVYVDVPSVDGPHALTELAARAGWTPADDGRFVLLVPYYATSAWHGLRTIDRLPVVSDLQLALDLWHYPLRGREQAEHLLGTMFPEHFTTA
jgi:hypothetical protein